MEFEVATIAAFPDIGFRMVPVPPTRPSRDQASRRLTTDEINEGCDADCKRGAYYDWLKPSGDTDPVTVAHLFGLRSLLGRNTGGDRFTREMIGYVLFLRSHRPIFPGKVFQKTEADFSKSV
jgi:hypothetical protein